MKKYISVFMAVLLLVGIFATVSSGASVVDSGVCGPDATWILDSDGVLTISGSGEMYNYYINNDLSNYGYPRRGETVFDNAPWYKMKKSVKEIKIAPTITYIGNRAFYECVMLSNVTLPEGVEEIARYAFSGCLNLETVTLPDSLTTIGPGAFNSCEALKSISLGTGISNIGRWAFYDCKALKDVYIKDLKKWLKISYVDGRSNPMTYGANLYVNNELLTELVITADMCPIGECAMEGCASLLSVTFPSDVSELGGDYIFMWSPNLKTVIVPDNITSLGWATFDECYALEKVVLGKGIDRIEQFTFDGVYNMSIFFTGTEEEWKAIFKNSDNGNIKTAPVHFGTTEHTPSDESIPEIIPATCVSPGQQCNHISCKICGKIYTEATNVLPINPDAHNFSNIWEAQDENTHKKTCMNNPEHVITENHSWDGGFIRNQSTFTQQGEKVYTCTVCSKQKVELLDKLVLIITTDEKTNISISYAETSFDGTVNIKIEVIEKPEIKVSVLKQTYSSTTVVDITPQIDGEDVQPSAPVEVTIPLPDGYEPQNTEVYHIEDSGNTTKMDISVADEMISFETDGFSKYVIVDTSTKVNFKLGFVDADDTLSAADARLALRAAVGLEKYLPFSKEFSAADIDNDGQLSSADARMILRAAVGLEILE